MEKIPKTPEGNKNIIDLIDKKIREGVISDDEQRRIDQFYRENPQYGLSPEKEIEEKEPHGIAEPESDEEISVEEKEEIEKTPEEVNFDIDKTRTGYVNAYNEYREYRKAFGGMKEKDLKVYEKTVEHARKFIEPGDSEKLKSENQGAKENIEAELRKQNFISELKKGGLSFTKAKSIYETELKKAEYETAKVELGKKLAEQGVEKAEIFKKLILDERELLNQAKIESWPPKEKNIFRKGMEWWMKKPTKTRLLYSTLALTGGLAAAGTIGGIGMLAGASMATIAKFGGLRFVRALAGATVGQGIAGGIEKTYGRKLARNKAEEEKILMAEFTIDNFSEIEKRCQQLQEKWYKKERNKTLVKAVAATIAGGGVAFGLGPVIEGALGIKIMPEAPPKPVTAPSETPAEPGVAPEAPAKPVTAPSETPAEPGVAPEASAEPKIPIEAIPEVKPEYLTIGERGPEGAIIDYFRDNPEIAVEKFGCPAELVENGTIQDLDKFNEWVGAKAHLLWLEDAKEALAKPETLEQLKKLGYSADADGYAKMMYRIGKGAVEINLESGKINLVDTEYLKTRVPPEVVAPPEKVSGLKESWLEAGKKVEYINETIPKVESTEQIFADVSPEIGRQILTEKLHDYFGMWSGTYDKFSDINLKDFFELNNASGYRITSAPWEDYDYNKFSGLQNKMEKVYNALDSMEKGQANGKPVETFIKKYFVKIFSEAK